MRNGWGEKGMGYKSGDCYNRPRPGETKGPGLDCMGARFRRDLRAGKGAGRGVLGGFHGGISRMKMSSRGGGEEREV